MKKIILLSSLMIVTLPNILMADDDVIPSVAKEQMSEYKSAFGKAIAESRKAEANAASHEKARKEDSETQKDNFGQKVSDAARNLKEEILKDNKNFGAWVSKQRSHRPDDVANAKGASSTAKASTAGGRPDGAKKPSQPGKSEGAGNSDAGKSNQSGNHPQGPK